ncbi:MAG: hypothetical protein V3S64_16185, partial [bacterium]
FTTYVVNYMLSSGMEPEVYAMSAMISVTSMVVILSLIVYLMTREEDRESEERIPGALEPKALKGRTAQGAG